MQTAHRNDYQQDVHKILPQDVEGFALYLTAPGIPSRGTGFKVRPDFKRIANKMINAEREGHKDRIVAVLRDNPAKLALDRVFRRYSEKPGNDTYRIWTYKVRADIYLACIKRESDEGCPLAAYPRDIKGSRYGRWKSLSASLAKDHSVELDSPEEIAQLRMAFAKYHPDLSSQYHIRVKPGTATAELIPSPEKKQPKRPKKAVKKAAKKGSRTSREKTAPQASRKRTAKRAVRKKTARSR
jgi:hypothetical protein